MRKKNIYVTGFDSDKSYIFGQNSKSILAMTLLQAKKDVDNFVKMEVDLPVVYKLVPVDPRELSKKKG